MGPLPYTLMAAHDTDPLIGWQANYASLHPATFNAIEDALRAELGLRT